MRARRAALFVRCNCLPVTGIDADHTKFNVKDEDGPVGHDALIQMAKTIEPVTRHTRELEILRPRRDVETRRLFTGKINMKSSAVRESVLAQLNFDDAEEACESCEGGFGPWAACATDARFFKGSCANCHYHGDDNRCSLRGTLTGIFAAYH